MYIPPFPPLLPSRASAPEAASGASVGDSVGLRVGKYVGSWLAYDISEERSVEIHFFKVVKSIIAQKMVHAHELI